MKNLIRNASYLVILLFILGTSYLSFSGYKNIESKEFFDLYQNTPNSILIDARDVEKFKENRIRSSFNVTIGELKSSYNEIKGHLEENVFIYSQKGIKSSVVAEFLAKKRAYKVYHLKNGLNSLNETQIRDYLEK